MDPITCIFGNYRFGYHTGYEKSLLLSIIGGTQYGAKCCQFYLSASRSYNVATVDQIDRCNARLYCQQYNLSFYIHSPLIINLANIKDAGRNAVQKIINGIADLHGAMVVHIGSVGTIYDTINCVNSFNPRPGSISGFEQQFLLENSAGQGTSIGKTWEELWYIFNNVDKNSVGICIDTQHIFASGMADLRTIEGVDYMFQCIETFIPGVKIGCFHLNDSKTDFGSRVDRHENVGYGKIWGYDILPMLYLMDICAQRKIDLILETPNMERDFSNLTRYRKFI